MSVPLKHVREIERFAASIGIKTESSQRGSHIGVVLKHPQTGKTTTMFMSTSPSCRHAGKNNERFIARFKRHCEMLESENRNSK